MFGCQVECPCEGTGQALTEPPRTKSTSGNQRRWATGPSTCGLSAITLCRPGRRPNAFWLFSRRGLDASGAVSKSWEGGVGHNDPFVISLDVMKSLTPFLSDYSSIYLSERSRIGEIWVPRKPEYDKDALIDAARDLFWRQGWAGTSMKDLEKTLSLKPGSFYAAFGSKSALFELALDRYAQTGAARLVALEEQYGPLGTLQRYPAFVIDPKNATAKACMLAKTVLELGRSEPKLAARADTHLTGMEARFTALFAAAQDAGEIDPALDPSALARRYQSDLLGLRVSAERGGDGAQAIAVELAESLARLAPEG